jgi:hypothetical protein
MPNKGTPMILSIRGVKKNDTSIHVPECDVPLIYGVLMDRNFKYLPDFCKSQGEIREGS